MILAPPTFETITLAGTKTDAFGTGAVSLSGSYTYLGDSSVTMTDTYSGYTYRAVNEIGEGTTIEQINSWRDVPEYGDGFNINWPRWVNGFDAIFQDISKTIEKDVNGTTVTRVYATTDGGEFIETIGLETTTESTSRFTSTSTTLAGWTTTNFATDVDTTTSATTQESIWTFADSSWVTSNRQATTFVATTTNGSKQDTFTTAVTATWDDPKSTIITCTSEAGNTVILVTGSEAIPYALTTTESVEPQTVAGTSTLYGEVDWASEGVGISSRDETQNLYVHGALVGYTATVRVIDTNTWTRTPFTRTGLRNTASAAVSSASSSPPQLFPGQIVATSLNMGGNFVDNSTTGTTTKFVLTHGPTTTSMLSYEVESFGPAQTTFTKTVQVDVDSWITAMDSTADLDLAYNIQGFSYSTAGQLEIDGYNDFISLTEIQPHMVLDPRRGFTSASAALQTSRINTMSFGVKGEGGTGASYQNTTFLIHTPNEELSFAPAKAHVSLPVSGSGKTSNFSFSYFGETISETTRINSTSTASTTRNWNVVGDAQTHWVHVSRAAVEGWANFPTIPALIVGGEGQALLPRGLYETYSGGVSNASGSQNFADGGSVSAFTATGGVTAVKPIPYFTATTGPWGAVIPVQSTSMSVRNNLTAQPIDD